MERIYSNLEARNDGYMYTERTGRGESLHVTVGLPNLQVHVVTSTNIPGRILSPYRITSVLASFLVLYTCSQSIGWHAKQGKQYR